MGGTSTDVAFVRGGAPALAFEREIGGVIAARADARHPHRRRRRRLDRLARLGRRAQGRPAERGRRSRARPATGAAAACRPSPTRTWCWAGSATTGLVGGAVPLDPARAEAAIDGLARELGAVGARDRARHRPRRQREHGQCRAPRHRAARRRSDRAARWCRSAARGRSTRASSRASSASARSRCRRARGSSARSACSSRTCAPTPSARTWRRSTPAALPALAARFDELERDARPLARSRARSRRRGGASSAGSTCATSGQNFELLVPVPDETWRDGDCAALRRRFFATHEQVYGFAAEDEPVQVVNVRLGRPRAGRSAEARAAAARRRRSVGRARRRAAASTSRTTRGLRRVRRVRPRAAPRRPPHRRSRGDRAVRCDDRCSCPARRRRVDDLGFLVIRSRGAARWTA